MTDKELSRLRRTELLEMLIAQSKEYAKLEEKLKVTEEALQSRELTINSAGTMAEAAYQLNDVMGSAQRAVDLYVENVKRVMAQQQEESDQAVNKARQYATETVAIAEKRARSLLCAANEQATQILTDARRQAERIVAQARENAGRMQGTQWAEAADPQPAPTPQKAHGLFKSRR